MSARNLTEQLHKLLTLKSEIDQLPNSLMQSERRYESKKMNITPTLPITLEAADEIFDAYQEIENLRLRQKT